jgi:hypothetical protein
LFVGKGNPSPSYFRSEFKFLKFKVVDMKKIDPDEFLRSDKPEEVDLGVLAEKYREKPEIFKKVIRKISKIIKNKKEILKYMEGFIFAITHLYLISPDSAPLLKRLKVSQVSDLLKIMVKIYFS